MGRQNRHRLDYTATYTLMPVEGHILKLINNDWFVNDKLLKLLFVPETLFVKKN